MELQASTSLVRCQALEHRFSSGNRALSGTDLEVKDGEFLAIVGPSGCGKSTLLRLIAGLVTPTGGLIARSRIDGGIPRCGFVFQSPTLLPWRNVQDNVRLPSELAGEPASKAREHARELLDLVGLGEVLESYPAQLSGGMRMRVSIARALAIRPALLLLDEPFAALDDITRNRLQEDLLRLRRLQGFTTVLVTHNIAEAAFLADRVLVMTSSPGRIHAEAILPFGPDRDAELRTSPELAASCREIAHRLREATA